MVSVCHVNVRSLAAPGRLDELKFLVSSTNIDILCLTETWLKPKHMNSTLEIAGYQPPIRRDRLVRRGGGVAIYVRNGLALSPISLSGSDMDIECLGVRVDLPKQTKLLVFVAYCPPDKDMCEFLDSLETVLCPHVHKNICLVGDFNAKHAAWFPQQATDSAGENLKLFTDSLELFQVVDCPTYNTCQGSSPSLLDLIFTNQPSRVLSSCVLPPIADHCPVQVSFSLRKSQQPKPYVSTHYLYSECNPQNLLQRLAETDWSFVSSGSVDQAVSVWTHVFMTVCNEHVPKKSVRVGSSSKPWYSNYLRYLGSCRDRLFKRCRGKSRTSAVFEAYRKTRNLLVAELRIAKQRYFGRLGRRLLSADLDPDRWWRLAKKACGWTMPKRIPPLLSDGQLVTLPSKQACLFNEHFQRQCSASPAALQPRCDSAGNTRCRPFSFSPINGDDVLSKLTHLRAGKSPGEDVITNQLLKLAAPEIAESLAVLFNRSLSEGKFPSAWKIGSVSPILKAGKNPSEPVSYRPVTLLSCLSKVLERLVHDQLLKYCLAENVIPDEQFGFLKGRSAEWQLLSVLEDWHAALEKHHIVHAAFLDASKAFDRVDHSALLAILQDIGICGVALNWFHSYLSDRLIQTRVSGVLSTKLPITSGVPQGSVLGPLLFLLYFKDIPSSTDASSALFADDTLLYRTDCQGNGQCSLSSNLSQFSLWSDRTKVQVNASKSANLSVGTKRSECSCFYEKLIIPKVLDHNHLGVTVSCDLKWSKHISNLIRNASPGSNLCKILAYRHHLPDGIIKKFYTAFVRPKLEYSSAVWCGASKSCLRRLERQQIQVARAISGMRDPVAALSTAELATLSWRRRVHCLEVLWKLVNNQGPPQLRKLLPSPVSLRSPRVLRSRHSLQFPQCRTTSRLSSFFGWTIPIWNSLPTELVLSASVSVFRNKLKQYFHSDKFTYMCT